MNKNKIFLAIVILFALILGIWPRLTYEYPRHVDEFIHYQFANHLSSGSPLYFGQEYNSLEAGFHCLLAGINSLGISYLFMFRFFPLIIIFLICLSAYILTKKIYGETAALFSVLFIGLLQSSSILMGPGFFVPLSIGLAFLMMTLFFVEIDSKFWILILAASFIIHPPSALAIVILLNIEFLIKKKEFFKNLGYQFLAFLIALPLFLPVFLREGTESLNRLSFLHLSVNISIVKYLGFLSVLLILFGIYGYIHKKRYSLIISSSILFLLLLISYIYHLELFIPSLRIFMYIFMIFSVFFGIGCVKIISLFSKKNKKIAVIVLIMLIFVCGMPLKINSYNSFSHIVNNNDSMAFSWIKENIDNQTIILADPIMSIAITPMAERKIFIHASPTGDREYIAKSLMSHNFFRNDCNNQTLLEENNISIIYGKCVDSNLTQLYFNVYTLKP